MKKVIVSAISVIVLVYAVRWIFNYTFKSAPWGIYKKLYQVIEEKKYYDVWVIGSSRAETSFETGILSQKTGLKFFNAGIHGAKPPQTCFLLKHVFHQHPLPTLVIFDIDVHNIADVDTVLNIEQFAPFMNYSDLRKDFSSIDPRINYAYFFPMYEVSFYGLRGFSKLMRILFNKPGRYDTTFQTTGCYHSHTDYQFDHYPDKTNHLKFHPLNLMYVDSIIDMCKKNKVNIILTVSPVFQPDSNISNAVSELKNFSLKKNVLLLDFSNIPFLSNDISRFSDKYHLKYNGSIMFTNYFFDTLINNHVLILHDNNLNHK